MINHNQPTYPFLLRQKMRQEEEHREAEKALKQLAEVDFDFAEGDFDSGLMKFLMMCHGFEQRQLGPAGLSGFQCAYLMPSEFREMFKRTFGVKVQPRELGALVRFFETSPKGVVNCTSFLNLFVQLRVRCEEFKGKADESVRLKAYHAELKEVYRDKTARAALMMDGGAAQARPWRIQTQQSRPAKGPCSAASGQSKAYPRPKTPTEKLKLRLLLARSTGRMDLSTKSRWTEKDGAAGTLSSPSSQSEAIPHVGLGSARGGGKLKDKAKKALRATHAAVDNLGATSVQGLAAFRLSLLPDEMFKAPLVTTLSELWLDNHNLGWLPSALGQLLRLEVLSVGGNNLEALPDELCLLVRLRRFYARKVRVRVRVKLELARRAQAYM